MATEFEAQKKSVVSTLRELIEIDELLKADITVCLQQITQNDSQFWRRTYIRAVFALVEGYTYRIKQFALAYSPIFGEELSKPEVALLLEESYELNDKGEAMTKPNYIQITKNIKFAFKVLARSFGGSYELKVDGSGWNSFKEALKVRNRLMHPKKTQDIAVSKEDIAFVREGYDWFKISLADVFECIANKLETNPPTPES